MILISSFLCLLLASCTTEDKNISPKDSSTQDNSLCNLEDQNFSLEQLQSHFETITQNVETPPTETILLEDTNGTLELGLQPDAFPILSSENGIFTAGSKLGQGRVIAFSGQDFIGSQDRSTLLKEPNIAKLVSNSVKKYLLLQK